MDIIFTGEKRPYYVLLKTGKIVEMFAGDILEISGDKELLEARRNQWEFNYKHSPYNTNKPPWIQ